MPIICHEIGGFMAKENTSIVVCGKKFDCGSRVVLWNEEEGLSFYAPGGKYGARNLSLKELRKKIDAFYVHYSVTYTCHSMFRGIKARGLSCNFMIDDDVREDGCATIFQCLDVKDYGFTQGGIYNHNGAGVEISYYPDAWTPGRYSIQNQKKWGVQPHEIVSGEVHGAKFKRLFAPTDAQVKACVNLINGYRKAFPDLKLEFPRDENGKHITTVAPPDQRKGLLHHYNVTRRKPDTVGFPTDYAEAEVKRLVEEEKLTRKSVLDKLFSMFKGQ
jgi:hypothetical protein